MRIYKKLVVATLIIATVICSIIPVGAIEVITPPAGLGTMHTYTVWDRINWGWGCKDLINFTKERNALGNSEGIVTYGGYFAGALTSTFGKVGDMLLVVSEGNIVYPVIIADTKSQGDAGCTKWGHHYGKCIVEFEILSAYRKSLYGTSGGYISELLAKPIVKVINLGSVYQSTYYFNNPKQAAIDQGLEGAYLLTSPYSGITITDFKGVFCNQGFMKFKNQNPMWKATANKTII